MGLHQHGEQILWMFLGVQQFSAVTTQSHCLPATELTGGGERRNPCLGLIS